MKNIDISLSLLSNNGSKFLKYNTLTTKTYQHVYYQIIDIAVVIHAAMD